MDPVKQCRAAVNDYLELQCVQLLMEGIKEQNEFFTSCLAGVLPGKPVAVFFCTQEYCIVLEL